MSIFSYTECVFISEATVSVVLNVLKDCMVEGIRKF